MWGFRGNAKPQVNLGSSTKTFGGLHPWSSESAPLPLVEPEPRARRRAADSAGQGSACPGRRRTRQNALTPERRGPLDCSPGTQRLVFPLERDHHSPGLPSRESIGGRGPLPLRCCRIMQTVYATHLRLPVTAGPGGLDSAAEILIRWVRARFKVEVAPLSGGEASHDDVDVRWESLSGEDGALVSATIDQPDRSEGGWRWRTYVDLGVEDGQAWLRIRVHLYSPLEGRLTSPKVQAGRPGIVRALTDALDIRIDDWPLGEWRPVARHQVAPYLEFLANPARQLPVVTLSKAPEGETFLDPARVADRLLGLAHIVVIEPEASYAVTDHIGKTLSCFGGAVRIYWPGFGAHDDPYFHRLFVGGSLSHYGRDGLEAELFEILGRLAGLSIDEPPLRRRLRIEKREQDLRRQEEDRQQLSDRLSAAGDAGIEGEAFEEFVEEFEAMRLRSRELEQAALEAEIEIDKLRRERDDAKDQVIAIARSINLQAKAAVVEPPAGRPRSVLEAVRTAAENSVHTIFLPEAFSSAEASQFEDPLRVAEDLGLIEEVARDWASGELAAGPHEAFKQRCSAYRDGIGNEASTRYSADYERTVDDRVVMLGPHLRRGIGPVATIMRIYMYFDTAQRRIVVGHVGRKLRDASNRN